MKIEKYIALTLFQLPIHKSDSVVGYEGMEILIINDVPCAACMNSKGISEFKDVDINPNLIRTNPTLFKHA